MYIKKLINSNSLLKQQTKIKKYFQILKKKKKNTRKINKCQNIKVFYKK